jgi:polar amino acid transport system permease protein
VRVFAQTRKGLRRSLRRRRPRVAVGRFSGLLGSARTPAVAASVREERILSESHEDQYERLRASPDRRYVLALVGALLTLVSFCLPLFGNRIVRTVTYYTDEKVVSVFPALVWDQAYRERRPPKNQEYVRTEVEFGTTDVGSGSGWAWVSAAMKDEQNRRQLVGSALCLIVALGGPILVGILSLWEWRTGRASSVGVVKLMFYAAIASILAVAAVLLYQVDFQTSLLKARVGELGIGLGYWGMALGSVLVLVSVLLICRSRGRPLFTWWVLVYGAAIMVWALSKFKPAPFAEIFRFLSDGIVVTLRITATSFLCILVAGLIGGLGRISKNRILNGIASLYVEIVRGIPLLVQLLFIWFALPQVNKGVGAFIVENVPAISNVGEWLVNLRLNPFTAAVIGLTVCYGAYMSEIFRAGIASISKGQMEAARSLGMSYFQAMRYVILPQAVRVILPPVGNEFVALLKDSSLVSVLAVSDLTRRGREYMARTFLSLETWAMVALIYLVMTLLASRVVAIFEERAAFEK